MSDGITATIRDRFSTDGKIKDRINAAAEIRESAAALIEVNGRYLALLDAPELDDGAFDFSGYAIPTFVRTPPPGASIMGGDPEDCKRLHAVVVKLRGRAFATTVRIVDIN